jgi:pimeloyl-ACP methyl ester carboxylesterase
MIKKTFSYLALFIFLAYLTAMAALYTFQDRLIFPAEPLPKNYQFTFDMPFTEINLPVDGAVLNALHFKQKNSRGVIFFLHGNTGNLVDWVTDLEFYRRENYDLFIFDYRGYGKSTGKLTSQAQAVDDVKRAWDFIAPQYKDKHIVIYGRSIGSALATQLAQKVETELLVLVSPFSNLIDIAKQRYPIALSWLLRFPFETNKAIQNVSSPVLLIHGDQDDYIPMSHSKRLQQLTQTPSKLLIITGADHSDIHKFDDYIAGLAKYLP